MLEKTTGYKLWQMANKWNKIIDNALKPLNISHAQLILMAGLHRFSQNKCYVRQVDLSKYCHTDINVTSQGLRKLETKGLLDRVYRKGNTKSKYPILTKEGQALLAQALTVYETTHADFFKGGGEEGPQPSVFLD